MDKMPDDYTQGVYYRDLRSDPAVKEWRDRGLSARAASALAVLGCKTADDISALGKRGFRHIPNIGWKTLAEIGHVIGEDWNEYPVDVSKISDGALISELTRRGYEITKKPPTAG